MARYKYSLKSADAKVAGVCSTLGAMTGVDPTFVRIGFVASLIMLSFQWTLIAYVALGIGLAVAKNKHRAGRDRRSEFDRMGEVASRKPSVHAMLNDFDANDRRMMAIDHHLNSQNDELAREIEALRKAKEPADASQEDK